MKVENSNMPETESGSPLLEFYNDSKIFITGGTGFLGKTLIEKLLRICTKTHIYLLIRTKKEKDPETRLKELFEDPLFRVLRKEKPDFEKNVTCISGNLSGSRLSMSDSNYEFLTNEVTHVFHSGATVRFNESLKAAVDINVKGTQEIVSFCNKCQQLKVFVHVSTAYSNCVTSVITEEFFEPPLMPEKISTLVDTLSEDKLLSLTREIIKPWPNTYAYTKAIAENVVKENAKSIPALIFRPSIVMGTLNDPVRGWIDNVYGPTGIVVGVGVGIIRVMYANPNCKANIVPADLTVNAILSCAWDVGSNFKSNNPGDSSLTESTESISVGKKTESLPKVFNFAADSVNSITWGRMLRMACKTGAEMPSEKAVWYYSLILTNITWIYWPLVIFLHFLPAYLIDMVGILLGKKTRMVKVYQKIQVFTEALVFFSCRTWEFDDSNTRKVWSRLSDKEKDLFNFNMAKIDWNVCVKSIIIGVRSYILKESEQSIPAAKRRMTFLWIGHRLLQFTFAVLCFWILSKFLFPYESVKTYLTNLTLTQTGILGNTTKEITGAQLTIIHVTVD